MSDDRKRPDGPKPGRRKPGGGERKRRYSEPPLPRSVPSREIGSNQHEEIPDPQQQELPDPLKKRQEEGEEA